MRSTCIDPDGKGAFLKDALSGAVDNPERKAETEAFFKFHVSVCFFCREEMHKYTLRLAMNDLASRTGVSPEKIVEFFTDNIEKLEKEIEQEENAKGKRQKII